MKPLTVATEYTGLIRGELDIESLLRTTLEFTLGRSGPTNAAVFLPTTSGDYSLGAYVNYDCPKDTCDILLDQLANSVAPKFVGARSAVWLRNDRELELTIGDEAEWLRGSEVIAYACEHEGECLAIFMLFRDEANAFCTAVPEQLETIGGLFAQQLARVIRIHHRHLPKERWGMIGDADGERDEDEGWGRAA